MANWVLTDTDVLIYAGRGVADAVLCLQRHAQQATLAVSVITEMELTVGCRDKRELQQMETFLKRYTVFPLDTQASQTALSLLELYRLSHGLLTPDALIAATALTAGLPLMTKN